MQKKELSKWNLTAEERQLLLPPLDPYGGPLAMSLEEFVEHPIARELLHDGQAYQVTLGGAAEVAGGGGERGDSRAGRAVAVCPLSSVCCRSMARPTRCVSV